jgi:CRP-like cAMP-binding protein
VPIHWSPYTHRTDSPGVDWSRFPDLSVPLGYPAGVELLQQNADIQAVHVIHEGVIKLDHLSGDGRSAIIGLRTAGSILGGAEALHDHASPTSAVTTIRTTVSTIPARKFRALFASDPTFCACVGNALGRDAHLDTLMAIERASYDARTRLMRFLTDLNGQAPERQPAVTSVRLPLTQAEIAQLLGFTPQHLSYLLAQLERQGLLTRKAGLIMWRPHASRPRNAASA